MIMIEDLFIIFLVTLIAFGPNKLNHLAFMLGKLIRQLNFYKQAIYDNWQTQNDIQILEDNILKAKKADQAYATGKKNTKKYSSIIPE
ncbi:MAG: Sec-independent protein translocase subunit TatA/TatB [Legionella sp.]